MSEYSAEAFQKETMQQTATGIEPARHGNLDNIWYYPYVFATAEYIFAQYYGMQFRRFQRFPINKKENIHSFYFEVYDWNLKPVVLLEFDSDIWRCAIDEKRKIIYTWNDLEDFDYLLVYEYDF